MELTPILLEVMDKVPTAKSIWTLSLCLGGVAFLVVWKERLRWLLLFLVFTGLLALGFWVDIYNLRAYIEAEAGLGYFMHVYAAMATGLALLLLGCLMRAYVAHR